LELAGEALQIIDAEIHELFDRKSLMTPDPVTGDLETPGQAPLKNGQPFFNVANKRSLSVLVDGTKKAIDIWKIP
jgi:hypothetical protein